MFDWIKNHNFKTLILIVAVLAWITPTAYGVTHRSTKSTHSTQPKKMATTHTTKKNISAQAKTKTNAKKLNPAVQTASTAKKNSSIHPAATLSEAKTSESTRLQNTGSTHLPGYLLNTIEKNVVGFVQNTISNLRYSTYKLGGTKIDTNRGVYVVDCSSYIDHILKNVYPRAYSSLTNWSGTEKPTTEDFYHYFTNLSPNARHWNTIDEVEALRPGDILVFRYKNRYGSETGGHVMIVMDKPQQEGNVFKVRIADSASTGHTKDTRSPRTSGIGIGTMLLKVNPKTYQPYAYAWKVGSRWETNAYMAMARPIDMS